MNNVEAVQRKLKEYSNPKKATLLSSFFKTGKGDYGEGDLFIGVTVPLQRKVAQLFARELSLTDLSKLLKSKVHEYRFTALEMLVMKFEKASVKEREEIVIFYLSHTVYINNWDLVDTSAKYILGEYLFIEKAQRKILYKLVTSDSLWERRISIVATHYFIDNNDFADTLVLAQLLMSDKHDLIHKAVGWMLREVGKKSFEVEEAFIKMHYKQMPRTMLRYALERFPVGKRAQYMKK